MIDLTNQDAELARERARRMFRAVCAGWAQDWLMLRSRGLDRPCSAPGRGGAGSLLCAGNARFWRPASPLADELNRAA